MSDIVRLLLKYHSNIKYDFWIKNMDVVSGSRR